MARILNENEETPVIGMGRMSFRSKRRETPFDEVHWKLHRARLASFLDHLEQLRHLSDDAREKYTGEYVLDRQYVVSLLDRSLEQLDELLFDAEVIAGDQPELDRWADRCQQLAQTLTPPDGQLPEVDPDGALHDEPEYRLLASFMQWIQGDEHDRSAAVRTLANEAVDRVLASVFDDRVKVPKPGLPGLEVSLTQQNILIADLGGGLELNDEQSLSVRHLRCEPLVLMLLEVGEVVAKPSAGGAAPPSWLAVVDRYHLSLRPMSAQRPVVLEASFSGQRKADWLFLYEPESSAATLAAPEGTRVERTSAGQMIWVDRCAPVLDRALSALGTELFGRGTSQVADQENGFSG